MKPAGDPRLRRELGEQTQDAVTRESAIVRAALAAKRMRPTAKKIRLASRRRRHRRQP